MSIVIRFLDRITGYGIEQGIEVHVDSGHGQSAPALGQLPFLAKGPNFRAKGRTRSVIM
jgi:hypothetical protein